MEMAKKNKKKCQNNNIFQVQIKLLQLLYLIFISLIMSFKPLKFNIFIITMFAMKSLKTT